MLDLSCIISSGDLELYVLDQLPPKEREQIAALAQIFPEVREEIQRIEAGLEKLASAEAVTPSSHVKDSVLSKIAAIQKAPVSTRESQNKSATVVAMKSYWKWAAAASIIILVSGWLWLNQSFQKLDADNRAMAFQMDSLKLNLNRFQEIEQALAKQTTQNIALASIEPNSTLAAKIIWDKEAGKVWLFTGNLPPAPAGKQYQLWCIQGNQPNDAGLVPLALLENGFVAMKACGQSDAFAITLENVGGSPTPTLDQLKVLGKTGS
ncbi:MAG: anti-sigma factor [Sediminibacterium sp.]|jgi:anti-sigma-K factor RskA|nr:anti-sigma factor [Sediminibacterium sp.]